MVLECIDQGLALAPSARPRPGDLPRRRTGDRTAYLHRQRLVRLVDALQLPHAAQGLARADWSRLDEPIRLPAWSQTALRIGQGLTVR